MMKEAELHADEDKTRHEEIELRNQADQAVYVAERMLQDSGDKVSATEKQPVEAATADLKKALDDGDSAAVKQALDQLNTAQHKVAEALYKAAQAGEASEPSGQQAGETSPPTGDGPEGDVIDAEVVEEDKK